MKITDTHLLDVKLIALKKFEDPRGHFIETWQSEDWAKFGLGVDFVQDNHSHSTQAGTVRGLHCQLPPKAQAKLIRVTRGRILDIAIDVRKGSPQFGQSVEIEMSAQNPQHLFIPAGFLHGFVTLADNTEVLYKCSQQYAPDFEVAVKFEVPASLGAIPHKKCARQISERDRTAIELGDFKSPFIYKENC